MQENDDMGWFCVRWHPSLATEICIFAIYSPLFAICTDICGLGNRIWMDVFLVLELGYGMDGCECHLKSFVLFTGPRYRGSS